MSRDYYLVLGISTSATAEDIRAAFRRRSKELHPDASGLGSEPFTELQEAYAVLSDPERKRDYDRLHALSETVRPMRRPPAEPITARRAPREFSLAHAFDLYRPSFDELFGRLWGNFHGERPKGERPESLTVEVLASPEEANSGGRVRIGVPAEGACPMCRGRGAVGNFLCPRCGGGGAMVMEHWIDVDYPAGMRDGHTATVPLSHLGIRNLYLTVVFRVSASARDASA